jgi:hypothetical protein
MGRSASTSQANQSATTTNQDNRVANDSGIVARDSSFLTTSTNTNTTNTTENNTTNNTTLDADVAKAAFDFATGVSGTNGDGFEKLLGVAKELTTNTQNNATSLATRFQDGMAQAYDQGRATTPGGMDQKTMVILGVAAAAAVATFALKKGK